MALPPSLLRELSAVRGATASADVPLAPLTTIRTGGKAGIVITAYETGAVAEVLTLVRAYKLPWCCLGAGSDLLIVDEGFAGVVIRLGEAFEYIDGLPAERCADSQAMITVGARVLLARFAATAATAGLAGLEFACGIPGSVGGGVATNAGAYGRALADVVTEVQLASADGVRWVPASGLEWGYRNCRLPEGVVVTAARLCLVADDPAAILERHSSILDMRRAVQPQGVWTFGSTFKNPSGGAAGRLLDAAGLKGERRGGAEVSRVHANFVVNLGDATTADILTLMTHMRHRVYETSGVWLEPEVRLLGGSFPWQSGAGGSQLLPPADG